MAAEHTPREEPTWKRPLWICLFLALSTLAVYWPVTSHDFVNYDDSDYVTANPYVQAGLSTKGLAWVWHSDVARNWHPVTMLSHMLDCQLYGLKPWGHHLTNILLHAFNTILVFWLLLAFNRNGMNRGEDGRWKMEDGKSTPSSILHPPDSSVLWRSAVVAALFAAHPLHVESVAWVAER
jgi:hypothetical protein